MVSHYKINVWYNVSLWQTYYCLSANKKLLVSWQFSGPNGVTKYDSGWRKDVVNQRLELVPIAFIVCHHGLSDTLSTSRQADKHNTQRLEMEMRARRGEDMSWRNVWEWMGGSCLCEWIVIWQRENMGRWCNVLLYNWVLRQTMQFP